MKRISIVGILSLILTLGMITVNAQTLYEGDLSSSAGWRISNSIAHEKHKTSNYNSDVHTTVSFSDGVMSVDGTWYAHIFFPQAYTSGVIEAEFSLKRNSGDSAVDFMNTIGTPRSAIYIRESGVVSINHQDGDTAGGANGVTLMKLLRRETDEWHDYVVRIDMDNQCAEYSVDGEAFENIPFTPWGTDVYKMVFERASVRNVKISHYYEVDIEKDGFVTENIYNAGEVTIKSVSPLPSGAFLAAAVYKNDKLISVVKKAEQSVSVNVGDGDTLKSFLWNEGSFTPLTSGVAYADKLDEVSEKGKELLYNYERANSGSGFDFSELSNTEILDEENVELYERETPDGTKYLRRSKYEKNIGTHGSWYMAGSHEEKEQNLLDLANAAAVKFPDGTQVANQNALYYIRTGNIERAEELIASKAESQHAFTDVSQYYMYFKYGHLLSDTAKANLKSTFRAEFENRNKQGFKWYSGTLGRLGNNHNQVYDGLVRGIFYAYAFLDDEEEAANAAAGESPQEVLATCTDILDKMVASTAISGTSIEEYNSQNYGAVVWAYVLALADLLPEGSENKAKAELILNRMSAEQAVLYHPQTVTAIAPHARSGFNLASGITIKQSMPLMLYGLSTREGYWQNDEATSYTFFYPQLASATHKLPDYIESIAYDKEYPQDINMTYRRIATKDAYLVDAGNQFLETSMNGNEPRFKHAETVGYMTDSYSMGSAPETPWYIPGLRGQETTFLARWSRDDTPDSLSDIPTLFSYYRYDIGRETIKSDSTSGYFTPVEQGLSATAQYKNKAIVYSYPGKVTDEKLAVNLGVEDYTKGLDFYNMGTSIYISHPDDTKIYVDGKKICDEEIITTDGNRELRAKLNNFPYTAENPRGNIYIEDKSIYGAIIPLNAEKVEIRDFTADVENNTQVEGGTTQVNSVYSINLFNNSFDTLSTLRKENFDKWTTSDITPAKASEYGYTGGANGGQIKIVEEGTGDKSIAIRSGGAIGKTFDTPYTEHFNINYNGTVSETYGDSGTVANGLLISLDNSKETAPYRLYLQLSDLGNLLYIRKNDGTFIKITEYAMGFWPVEKNSPWTEIYPSELKTAKDNNINIDVDIRNKLLTITLENSNGTSTYSKALPDEITGVSGFDLFAKDTVTQSGTEYFATFDDIEYYSNFTEAQRHDLRNGYIFEIAEKSEYASIADFIEHIESASFTTSESNNIWTTEYTSGGDTLKLCFDTDNLYVTESYANGVAYKNAYQYCYDDSSKHMFAKTADEDYYYWNKTDFYKQNPTVFKSENLIQSQAAEVKIGDCTLTNIDEAMVYVIYSPKTKTYVVGDLTAGKNSYTLTTPYGTVKIDNLELGYVEFDGETKEISLNSTDSTATAVVQQ